jgi:cytochrome c-type biogenesis protein CcmI
VAPVVNRTQREFLERSLEDLERERDAGDLSDRDYAQLKADYERRLEGDEPPPRPPARPGFVVASVAFVVVVAVAAGVLVAQAVGRREDGGTITGGGPVAATTPPQGEAPAASLPEDLARCTTLPGSEAIDCYTAYTDANPDDPAGYTQFGLFAINNGIQSGSQELLDAGESFLRRALELEPDDVEARVYLAVVLDRTGRADEAAAECARLAGAEIPAGFGQLVDLACGG